MPLFECEQCHCVENTAMGEYWGRDKKLCSECGRGEWHGCFDKKPATGMLMEEDGFLWNQEQIDAGNLPKYLDVSKLKVVS